MRTEMSSILLAEDHRILREGLRAILAGEPDMRLVGEAGDGREAIRFARQLKPDVVILDLSMPRMDGLTALAGIKRVAPEARVLVMTAHRAEEYVLRAVVEGASGYLLKDAAANELLLAVRSLLAGEPYFCSSVATPALAAFLQDSNAPRPRSALDTLSPREREVLKLVAEGYRNREIAELLFISEKTVEKHRASLMRKLQIKSAAGLTAFAIERGLVVR